MLLFNVYRVSVLEKIMLKIFFQSFLLFFLIFVQVIAQAGDEVTTTEEPKKVDCLIDESKPKYVPNLYQCEGNKECCFNEGQHSCCATDVSSDSIKEQVILWGVLIAILLVIGIAGLCYFKDNYCCGGDPDDEEITICCCFKRKKQYKKKINVQEKLYPDEAERYKVDDPIFGKVGKPEDVPQFAAIDYDTEQKAVHI